MLPGGVLMAHSLVDAALRRRQEEQVEAPVDDGRDPWAIRGPVRCVCCREPMDEGTVDLRCPLCRVPRRPKACGISGCNRPARANGRCRKHVHGEDMGW